MNATAQTDMVNWIGVILILLIIAITLTIVKVKEFKYYARSDARTESDTERNEEAPTNGARR